MQFFLFEHKNTGKTPMLTMQERKEERDHARSHRTFYSQSDLNYL